MRTWVKLYTEIIRDPKMHNLGDHSFRVCINLFALAGQLDLDGKLGTTEEIAFHLRMAPADIAAEMGLLADVRVTCNKKGVWWLKNWDARNGKAQSDTHTAVRERVQKHRENKAKPDAAKRDGNADVTPLHDDGNAPREEKNREEEIRVEEMIEEPAAQAPAPPTHPPEPPLSEGQKIFLQAFGAKRFKNTIQRNAVLVLENDYGCDLLRECVAWAAKRGMTLGAAVPSVEKAIKNWGKPKTSGVVGQNGGSKYDAMLAHLESLEAGHGK